MLFARASQAPGRGETSICQWPERLQVQSWERADASGITVTAPTAEAVRDVVRDPRLGDAAQVFRQFVARAAGAFDAAFPSEAPACLDATSVPGRAR
ncbi:hypothetical protein [Streptomyces chrestomyceticus]|uniref:hypothetical protein n=1 Tax=Streptomyces chrestomyceticus TaxID=68185 RepID=UPI001FD3863A|nr:hypothetical protein [Streptomyces chrestomyceticus]